MLIPHYAFCPDGFPDGVHPADVRFSRDSDEPEHVFPQGREHGVKFTLTTPDRKVGDIEIAVLGRPGHPELTGPVSLRLWIRDASDGPAPWGRPFHLMSVRVLDGALQITSLTMGGDRLGISGGRAYEVVLSRQNEGVMGNLNGPWIMRELNVEFHGAGGEKPGLAEHA